MTVAWLAAASAVAWGQAARPNQEPHSAVASAGPPLADWADRAAVELSLDQQVGQLLLAGFNGLREPRFVRVALREDRLSGVILFQRNVRSPKQLRALTKSIRSVSGSRALISVDQEGGLVRRIKFARPRQGQPNQGLVSGVRRVASQAAGDLRALGVQVNFAPVADVPSGPQSDIFPRAFHGSPQAVARKVVAATLGYRDGRVAATVKHFPGLGAAPRNTDNASVTIRRTARQLSRIDLVPFRAAIKADVPMIMVSHAIYPALDAGRAASQSTRVVRGLLRDRLRFGGVAVTDALEARAIVQRHSVASAAKRSLAAGCDLLLLASPSSYGRVFGSIRTQARTSASLRRRIRESAARVLVLKRSLGLKLPTPEG
jgi:beta-N-acetylhexosaminidase